MSRPVSFAAAAAAAALALAGFAAPAAAETRPPEVRPGYQLVADFGSRVSIAELRRALHESGFDGWGPGYTRGRDLRVTAYASDGKRYLIEIDSYSGEVTYSRRISGFWL